MDIFSSGYYRINRICLSLCGIWPEQSCLSAYIARFIVFGTIISIVIPEVIYLYEVAVSGSIINDVIPCLPPLLAIFAAMSKYFLMVQWSNTFQSAVDKIRSDWTQLKDAPESGLMHEYALRGYINNVYYMGLIFVTGGSFLAFSEVPIVLDIIFPLNETRKRTPIFDAEYGVENPDDYYLLITFHAYITTLFVVHILWTVDPFIMIMVQHCCGLFEIVGFTLKNLNEATRSKDEEEAIISYAISIHQRAIEFAVFIEESLTNMYACLIVINMFAISLTGVETVIKIGQTEDALRFASFTLGQTIHLFFNSLPGQQLVDHSSSTFESIYDANWHSMSMKSKKAILMMLVRSKKSCMLTAGGFYELNMENFSQIMQASMSYLTVLISMR